MIETRPARQDPRRALLHPEECRAATIGFSRHRYELPLLGVFLALALIELVAVHLLVMMWSGTAAWVLTALSLAAMGQIARLIHGLVTLPTEIGEAHVMVRHGRAGRLVLPLADIERADDVTFAPELKGRSVFRASLLASPNVSLRLARPLRIGRRQVRTVTVRLDESAAFLNELRARLGDRT